MARNICNLLSVLNNYYLFILCISFVSYFSGTQMSNNWTFLKYC